MLLIYALAIFVSATLLFTVQPMVGRMMLPVLGGSPAIWNTCLVFFQASLLAGYAYAHVLTKLPRREWQVGVHVAMLIGAALTLPIDLPAQVVPPADGSPVWFLLETLALTCGVPFTVMSATAPLLQRWFAMTDHPSAADPYFLYVASNAGSLLSLLAYPFVIERAIGLSKQTDAWSLSFGVFVVLVTLCGMVMVKRPRGANMDSKESVHEPQADQASGSWARSLWGQRLWWVALSAVPSSLLMGCTQYITTDVAAFPLFWVLPLAMYLLTFMIAFSPKVERQGKWPIWLSAGLVPLSVAALVVLGPLNGGVMPVSQALAAHLTLLFGGALSCHLVMARGRPEASRLTEFFLLTSLGGVIGGSFNALLAPVIFDSIYEYPIAVAAASTLVAIALTARCSLLWKLAVPIAGIAVLAAAAWMLDYRQSHRHEDRLVVHQERSFFGVHRVMISDEGRVRLLMHGTTNHGIQLLDERGGSMPSSYYHMNGPVGETMRALWFRSTFQNIAVVGLGTGSIAAYGQGPFELPDGTVRPAQRVHFYEIDPAVARIAQDDRFFTFLKGSKAQVSVILGDARQTLPSAPEGFYSLIVLDAFSSDAIPTHLLTVEALEGFASRLAPDGILLVHISNRHLSLGLMVGRGAKEIGMIPLGRDHSPTDKDNSMGASRSTWVALARTPQALGELFNPQNMDAKKWWFAFEPSDGPLWTDDYADILACLQW
jgi:spermidine synthase